MLQIPNAEWVRERWSVRIHCPTCKRMVSLRGRIHPDGRVVHPAIECPSHPPLRPSEVQLLGWEHQHLPEPLDV